MISGRVTAKPICIHWMKPCAPPSAPSPTTSGSTDVARGPRRWSQREREREREPAPLLAEFGPGVVHRAEGAAQFLRQFGGVPALGFDRLEQLQMLGEALVGRADLLEFFCESYPSRSRITSDRDSLSVISARPRSNSSWRRLSSSNSRFCFSICSDCRFNCRSCSCAFCTWESRCSGRHRLFFVQLQHLFDRSDSFCHEIVLSGRDRNQSVKLPWRHIRLRV